MRFVFNERKTAQAAAFFLRLSGGHMPYIKLLKLLYLCDRQSIIETGYPVTGAKLVSMDKGPVLSEVLDRITWGDGESVWSEYISSPSNYEVSLTKQEPDEEELSEYEKDLLLDVFRRFGDWDRWALVRFTHELPEWTDPSGSALPIDARRILESAGKSDEEIEHVSKLAEEIWSFSRVAILTG